MMEIKIVIMMMTMMWKIKKRKEKERKRNMYNLIIKNLITYYFFPVLMLDYIKKRKYM